MNVVEDLFLCQLLQDDMTPLVTKLCELSRLPVQSNLILFVINPIYIYIYIYIVIAQGDKGGSIHIVPPSLIDANRRSTILCYLKL